MKCPKCGANMPDHAKFCVKCGASLTMVSGVTNTDETIKEKTIENETSNVEKQNVEQKVENTSSSNNVEEVNTASNEAPESVDESEQVNGENSTNSSSNPSETTQNVENVENENKPDINENVEKNNVNQTSSETTTNTTNSAPKSSFGSKVKDLLLGTDKFFLARSVLMYAIIGGSTLVLFIIGVTLGWSALMFIPLIGIGLAVLAYLQEIRKIEIKPESLARWNEKRANNVVFKYKVKNPDNLGNKLQYWHDYFKPSKYLAWVLSIIALILPHITLVTATVTTTLNKGGKITNNGGYTYVRKYEGFYPDAEYVIKYQAWEKLLFDIWDPIWGRESYNSPMGSSVWFTIATEYKDPSELEDFKSQVVGMGYTFTETGTIGHGSEEDTLCWYYEKDWGPSTTWHEHCYHCKFTLEDMGWDKNYSSYYAYMEYMFFNYGPNE